MLTTAVTLLLCASSPVRVAATSFQVSGDDAKKADVWIERFAEVMRRDPRLEVTTPSALASMLGFERQRELLGCNENKGACMAELASALGADGILGGSITRSGESYLAVLRLVRQKDGKVWWSTSSRVKGEEALLDWLDAQAESAVSAIFPKPKVLVAPLVTGLSGVAAIGVGTTLLVLSNTTSVQAVREAQDVGQLEQAVNSGRAQGIAGIVLLGVGGAAAITSFICLAVQKPADSAPALSLVPLEGGAFASIGGRW